jgi:hypothetical protein
MKKRLIVVVQDGSIAAVVADNPDDFREIELVSINYDCDIREDIDLVPVVQSDGSTEFAFVDRWEVDQEQIRLRPVSSPPAGVPYL